LHLPISGSQSIHYERYSGTPEEETIRGAFPPEGADEFPKNMVIYFFIVRSIEKDIKLCSVATYLIIGFFECKYNYRLTS